MSLDRERAALVREIGRDGLDELRRRIDAASRERAKRTRRIDDQLDRDAAPVRQFEREEPLVPARAKTPLTAEEAIADLRKWATDHGRVPFASDYNGAKNGYDRESYERICSTLGSWRRAVEDSFGPDVDPGDSWPTALGAGFGTAPPEPEQHDEPIAEEKPIRSFAEIAAEVERAAIEMDESASRYEALAAELIEHPLFGRIDDERA